MYTHINKYIYIFISICVYIYIYGIWMKMNLSKGCGIEMLHPHFRRSPMYFFHFHGPCESCGIWVSLGIAFVPHLSPLLINWPWWWKRSKKSHQCRHEKSLTILLFFAMVLHKTSDVTWCHSTMWYPPVMWTLVYNPHQLVRYIYNKSYLL
jgi:hypothetical protein